MRKIIIIALLAASALASQAALADAAVTWSPGGNITITATEGFSSTFLPLFTCNMTLTGTVAVSSTLGTKLGQINAATINACSNGHTFTATALPWVITSKNCPTTTSVLTTIAKSFMFDTIAFSGSWGVRFNTGTTVNALLSTLSNGGTLLAANGTLSPSSTIGCA